MPPTCRPVAKFGPDVSNSGPSRPFWAKFGQTRPALAKHGKRVAKVCSISVHIALLSVPKLGSTWPHFGQVANMGTLRPTLVNTRPMTAEIGPIRAVLLSSLGQRRPMCGNRGKDGQSGHERHPHPFFHKTVVAAYMPVLCRPDAAHSRQFGTILSEVGPSRPDSVKRGRKRPRSTKHGQHLATLVEFVVGIELVLFPKSGDAWPALENMANFGPLWTTNGQHRSNLVQIGPLLVHFGPTSAEAWQLWGSKGRSDAGSQRRPTLVDFGREQADVVQSLAKSMGGLHRIRSRFRRARVRISPAWAHISGHGRRRTRCPSRRPRRRCSSVATPSSASSRSACCSAWRAARFAAARTCPPQRSSASAAARTWRSCRSSPGAAMWPKLLGHRFQIQRRALRMLPLPPRRQYGVGAM